MKGSLHTDELLGAVVARETGFARDAASATSSSWMSLRITRCSSITDAAINIAPALEDKADICQNAIDLAIALGRTNPKVAILAAVETVTSKMPATIDAAALCKMARARADHGRHSRRAAGVRQRDQQGSRGYQGHSIGSRRRSGHPSRARSRSRQHAREAAQLPGQCRQRGTGAGSKGTHYSDQPLPTAFGRASPVVPWRCWSLMRGATASAKGVAHA